MQNVLVYQAALKIVFTHQHTAQAMVFEHHTEPENDRSIITRETKNPIIIRQISPSDLDKTLSEYTLSDPLPSRK
jgi:hypothetical protein